VRGSGKETGKAARKRHVLSPSTVFGVYPAEDNGKKLHQVSALPPLLNRQAIKAFPLSAEIFQGIAIY
jgi:hypothetical protein